MATLTSEQLHILWYLLAGFILGFACSTLWEWLYFRRVRLGNNSAQQAARTRAWVAPDEGGQGVEQTARLAHSERPAMHYQNQGILLENEQNTEQLFVVDAPFAGSAPVVIATPLVVGTSLPVRKAVAPATVATVARPPTLLAPTTSSVDEEATLNSTQENI